MRLLLNNECVLETFGVNKEKALEELKLLALGTDLETQLNNVVYELDTHELEVEVKTTIMKKYPQGKQNSDLGDLSFYDLFFKSKKIDIADLLAKSLEDFNSGKSLNDIENSLSDTGVKDYAYEFLQILKAYIRINWVNTCKKILKETIDNNGTDISLPEFPNI